MAFFRALYSPRKTCSRVDVCEGIVEDAFLNNIVCRKKNFQEEISEKKRAENGPAENLQTFWPSKKMTFKKALAPIQGRVSPIPRMIK